MLSSQLQCMRFPSHSAVCLHFEKVEDLTIGTILVATIKMVILVVSLVRGEAVDAEAVEEAVAGMTLVLLRVGEAWGREMKMMA